MNKMIYPVGLCAIFKTKREKIRYLSFIFAFLFFLAPQVSNASHIVGGEMSYRCLGDFTYEVKLTVYRDCYGATPNAIFDPIASIGVFDANNELVISLNGVDSGQLLIPQTIDDTLIVTLSDPCLFAPDEVCVHSMTYMDTIVLPPISGGYQLVYQRCCRNTSISNIVNSFDTGASFTVNISEEALLTCNSSPELSAMPPLFLCVNEPFVFDQSVIDADGDSLVYRLCTPFDGASFDDPRPQPPNPPPYDEINWQDPPYDLDNLLGGTPLEIDPETGIIAAVPNTQGIFLVGLCIEEYRDGVLISESRREFQYNVGVCGELVADIAAPELQCDNLEIQFENNSINAESYYWEFNDPQNPDAASTEKNPTFTFSELGTYNVMLVAQTPGPCSDTTYQEVTFSESALEASFSYLTLQCTDSVELALVDTSVDSLYNIESWRWKLSDDQTSNEQFPTFILDSAQQLTVTLEVTSSNGCTEVFEQVLSINLIPSNLLPEEVTICAGDSILLNPSPMLTAPFTYQWSPSEELSADNIANPMASPEEDIVYTLTVTDQENDCIGELTTSVVVLDSPTISFNIAAALCGSETLLIANSSVSQGNFIWSTDSDFDNILSEASNIIVSTFGETTYYVQFSASGSCTAVDSITVVEQSVNVEVINSAFICVGETAQFYATNLDSNDILSYSWFDIGVLSTDSILEITPTEAGQNVYYFQAENQYGCNYLDSVLLVVADGTAPVEVETSQACNDNVIKFTNLSPNSNYYEWIIELPDGNETLQGPSVEFEFPAAGTYTVNLEPIDGLPCELVSETIEVTVLEELVTPNFDWSYVECGEELVIQFNDLSQAIQGNIVEWSWKFGDYPIQLEQNPILELDESEMVKVELTVTTDEGCSNTVNEEIEFSTFTISNFEEELVICDENSITLNPMGNEDFEYEWSPASLLDDENAASPIATPSATTTFSVTITDPNNNNCAIEKSVLVTIPDDPVIAQYEYEVVNCDNDITLSFTDTSTPSSEVNNWFWQFSDGQFSNSQNTIIVAEAGMELGIQFQVQTEDGCTDILLDTITIENFNFDLPQSGIVKCSGLPVNLNPSGNPDFSYNWSPSATLNNDDVANPIANPIETTEYCVTVTNGTCSLEKCVTVVVPEIPLMANFSYNISDCIDEAQIFFQDESQYSLDNIIEWNWTFSNGASSDLQNPILTVEESSILEATLNVVTADNCEAEFSQLINISLIETNLPNQVVLCEGNPIVLNPNGNPNHTYEWSPSSGLTDDDIPSPFAFPQATTTYSVTISDGDCEVVQLIEVVVPDVPLTADFSYEIDDCTDIAIINFEDQSNYEPGEIGTWKWQFSNGDSSDIADPSLILDQSQILEVILEVTTNDGCVEVTNQFIPINLIDINLPAAVVNCNNEGIELNPGGNPYLDYEWFPTDDLSNPNIANPIANPSTTTTYSVTVSDGPCEISRTVTVEVPDEIVEAGFTYNFDDCTDNAIIEFTNTTGLPNSMVASWDWTFTGNNTFGSDLENPVIILNQSDTIIAELTVTTVEGCTSTISEEIEVNLIDINISGSIIYCNSQGVTLNPNGNPDYEYEWAPSDGLSASDIASPTLTGLTETTNYSVTVTFGNCTLTRNIEILIPDQPLVADMELNYLTCIDSATIQLLDASLFSESIIEWDWLVNFQVSEEQNPTFVYHQDESINVQLIVTTPHGCKDTVLNSFDINVMDDVEIPNDLASCNGNGVFLNPDSNPDYSYHWSPGIGLSGDTLIANPFASPDSSQIYMVNILDPASGCSEERSVAFNVPTVPLTAGFEWDLSNCADSATLEFSDTSHYSGIIDSWAWTIENGITDTLQNPVFVFPDIDTLDVKLVVMSNDGCIDSITQSVAIDIIDIGNMADTINLCTETSAYLNPSGNTDLFYNWSPGESLDSTNISNPLATPLETTKYFVTITSPNNIGCNEVRTVEVRVPTEPIDLTWNYPMDTIICTPNLELLAQSNNATTFEWSDQPDFQNILSDDPEFMAFPNNQASYYLRVTDNAGCTLSESIEITSYTIQAELEDEVTICYGDSIQLEVELSPLTPSIDLSYTWSPQEGIVMANNTSTPVLSPEESTEYTLLIENQFDCFYEDTIQVNVIDIAMDIELTIDLDSINAGETIQILSGGDPDWIYKWSPCETLDDCDTPNPFAAPEVSTTYVIEIEDGVYNCTYIDSISIFVFDDSRCEEPYVFVPKGFTPNDDGLNDILYVRGNYIEEVEFVIFNRWGEKVFETKDINVGWDGKVDGKNVPPDVFGYYVSIKCFGGEEYLMKGDVTLIR